MCFWFKKENLITVNIIIYLFSQKRCYGLLCDFVLMFKT